MNASDAILYRAGAVITSAGRVDRPGAVAVVEGRAAWAGPGGATPEALAQARVVELPDRLLLPGMMNAHAHLELTAIGPRPYTGDFVSWVAMLREHWPGDGPPLQKRPEEAWFESAAARGAAMMRGSGVVGVGDVCRSEGTIRAWRKAGLMGVGFIELFGLGEPWDEAALDLMAKTADGLQPHAPYSAGPRIYERAAQSGRPVSTHLAETHDEAQFVASADGPFRALLESLGKWDEAHAGPYRQGLTPVQWMRPYLERASWLVAHCNHVSDEDIAILAGTRASVAYCPVASEYFGHAGHRYRDMLAAGVNVCLGTDSIVCQDPEEPQPLGVLAQMRRLYRRDGADPRLLLRMATTHGRRALGLPDRDDMFFAVKINPDDSADPLVQILTSRHPMEPLPDA